AHQLGHTTPSAVLDLGDARRATRQRNDVGDVGRPTGFDTTELSTPDRHMSLAGFPARLLPVPIRQITILKDLPARLDRVARTDIPSRGFQVDHIPRRQRSPRGVPTRATPSSFGVDPTVEDREKPYLDELVEGVFHPVSAPETGEIGEVLAIDLAGRVIALNG